VPGPWQPACTACHGLHDPAGTNLSAISPLLHNLTLDTDKAVLFSALSGQGSFDDGDPANDDGICQVCHTATAFHVHDGSGMVHNDATDCTACHEHRIGFRIPEGESSCIACHSQPQGPRSAVVAPDGSGAHHLGAEPMRDSDCLKCHDMTLHREGNVRLWQNPNAPSTVIELTGQPLTDPAESDKLIPFCTSCHSSTGHSTHAVGGAWQPSCGTCHDLHNPANTNLRYISPKIFNQTLSQFQDVVLTGRTGPGSFSDGVGANDGVCQVCHTGTKFHLHDGSGASHNAGVDCTACHAHNAGFLPVDSTSCIACHSSPQGSRPAVINADGTGGHHLGTGPLVDADCAGCHDTSQHQQGVVRLWTNPANPSVAFAASGDPDQLSPFCGTCHGGLTSPTTHTTGASWEPACMECHVLHDPSNTNWSLVSESIMNQTLGQQQPVVFTARTGANSFSDGIGADDGVCQVCHTSTTYHLYDGGGASHNPGADCTACHSHDSGFIPSGSSSCVGCHSGAQGSRRAVVTEFGLASHHVADASVTDADCQVCHDQSQHQQGQVRLKNADNASTVYVLSGDPMSIASEAAVLEPFCLACHDSDAAGGAVPFSDGLTPTVIDATAWAGAVHAAGQTTCVGDGETFGCHSTGHGSVKANLLAPWNGSQPAITGDALRQEEGLCYSCHDADGPAATNVQAQFALSSHHNVSDVDQVDGSKVECIHCHNPHLASTLTPLIDPDSGAAWAGTGEAFCLKCHNGTPPAGVSFPAAAPGSGYDKSAFVGSTHDTLAGADNCRQCHEQHGSANLATLKNRYVVADFNKYSTGDGDYASCWDCHNENFVIEQKNRFEGFHKKHVKGEDAPCITCHDAHRSYDAGEPGLINLTYPNQQGFDFQFIDGKDASTAFWLNAAQNQGNCYLRCHGKKHDPKDYKR
ncbi:MAG: hypothetical protein ACE5GE_13505, partial [Phycisphaerae bacterium]